MGLLGTCSLGIFVALVAFLSGPISHIIRIGGVFLTPNSTVLGEGQGPIYIEDTIHCEDVHHYRPANLLFTACEDYKNTRFSWFPPLGNLVPATTSGSIHVVDPKVCALQYSPFLICFTLHTCPLLLYKETNLTTNQDNEINPPGIYKLQRSFHHPRD